jgi:hypothetical protein
MYMQFTTDELNVSGETEKKKTKSDIVGTVYHLVIHKQSIKMSCWTAYIIKLELLNRGSKFENIKRPNTKQGRWLLNSCSEISALTF